MKHLVLIRMREYISMALQTAKTIISYEGVHYVVYYEGRSGSFLALFSKVTTV